MSSSRRPASAGTRRPRLASGACPTLTGEEAYLGRSRRNSGCPRGVALGRGGAWRVATPLPLEPWFGVGAIRGLSPFSLAWPAGARGRARSQSMRFPKGPDPGFIEKTRPCDPFPSKRRTGRGGGGRGLLIQGSSSNSEEKRPGGPDRSRARGLLTERQGCPLGAVLTEKETPVSQGLRPLGSRASPHKLL